jgi:hypothetical protein
MAEQLPKQLYLAPLPNQMLEPEPASVNRRTLVSPFLSAAQRGRRDSHGIAVEYRKKLDWSTSELADEARTRLQTTRSGLPRTSS